MHKISEPKAEFFTETIDTGEHQRDLLPTDFNSSSHQGSALPFYCFLSQHPVPCQECDTSQNGQVLQSLEHVELSPVDIHESQHCCEKKTPWLKLRFSDRPFVILRTIVILHCQAYAFGFYVTSETADLKTLHYCQGKAASGSPYWRKTLHQQLATNPPVTEIQTYSRFKGY